MTMPQTALLEAIDAAMVGAPGVGEIIIGGLSEVDFTSQSATLALEYGPTVALDPPSQRLTGDHFYSLFTFYADLYWNGAPANWSERIYDDAYGEVWRRIVALALPVGVLRLDPAGHDEPALNTEGDRQHVYMRTIWTATLRHPRSDPEA